MPIDYLIAHKVERAGPNAKCELQLREEVFALNGLSEEFFRELRQTYIKKLGKVFGRFSSEPSNYFAPLLDEFLADKLGFAKFTQQLTKNFAVSLESIESSPYGYFVYAMETLESARSLYVFFVETTGMQYMDGELMLHATQILDVSSISFGARINISEWKSDASKSYLGVLPCRGDKELSENFSEFIGFTDKRDVKNETEQFLQAVDEYVNEMPEEQGLETKSKVVEFCLDQDKTGDAVSIEDLSSYLNVEEPKQFSTHVEKACPELDTSLIPDKTQMRNYMRISGRNELLSMSFASDCLGQTVIYDENDDSLIITSIPPSLKSRLQKHLKSKE